MAAQSVNNAPEASAIEPAKRLPLRVEPPPGATAAFRVQRLALPRYQVEYLEQSVALAIATRLREKRILVLEYVIPGDVGGELVLDLALLGESLQVALFFRILKRSATATALEWVPRRATDTDLLELWMQAVELRGRPASHLPAVVLSEAELSRALEMCRRALQRNPFTALKVHWTAGEAEISAATESLMSELAAVSNCGGVSSSVTDLVGKAIEAVKVTREMVSTVEGRRRARGTFVPVDQLRQAIELAISKADLARLRGDLPELARARAEMTELGVGVAR